MAIYSQLQIAKTIKKAIDSLKNLRMDIFIL